MSENVAPQQESNQIPTTEVSTVSDGAMPRTLKFHVFRHNPADPASDPHIQVYEVEEGDSMTLFIALKEIRETMDPELQFDFVCRAGICGSCAMVINGEPGLACRTLTKYLPPIG